MENIAVVLGAAGFIGRNVCRRLSSLGLTIIGIGHGSWAGEEWRTWGIDRWIEADVNLSVLQGLEVCGSVECIVHCAGSGAVSFSYASPWDDYQRATVTTAAVLEWIRTQLSPKPRLVLVSSAAVYGDQGDSDAFETSVRSPISPYGFHKLSAEVLCESYSRFFEVPVSIVRLFSVYGEGLRKQLLWDALYKFSRGEHEFFGTGHELRDWVHIEDAAQLLCAAALMPQTKYAVYNGGHEHATTGDVLSHLARETYPELIPKFSGQMHLGNPRRLTANCTHTSRLLSWVPSIRIDHGIKRYAEWFKNHLN